MKTRVQRWGEQLAICIPNELAIEKGLHEDTDLEVAWVEGHLEIRVAEPNRVDLQSLLSRITPENRHGEWDTGSAAGNEE